MVRSLAARAARIGVVLALAAVGLVATGPTASADSTGCAGMNGASVQGVYNPGSATGDFVAGEVIVVEVGTTDAVLATFTAVGGALPALLTSGVPGRIAYEIPSTGRYDLAWSVPGATVQEPTWAVSCVIDGDLDGIGDAVDNCPNVANADQADADHDGQGDACDGTNSDVDGDGVLNEVDNCVQVVNADQADVDADGQGDACDAVNDDVDADGVFNEDDNCAAVANSDQSDVDGDGIGDLCDPTNDDLDADGVPNVDDNCPLAANGNQADSDHDGIGNVCDPTNDDLDNDGIANGSDNCPLISNVTQADNDGDGIGNPCDPVNNNDLDNDGIANGSDNCPQVSNLNQANNDGDSAGDLCDPDDDNDGVADLVDHCPKVFGAAANGCAVVAAAPVVALTAPTSNAVLSPTATTVIAATATDAQGIFSVTFWVGSRSVCVDKTAPYTCSWKPAEREKGKLVLAAVGRDTTGVETRVSRTVTVNRFTPVLKVGLAKAPAKKVRAVGSLVLPTGTTALYSCSGTVTVRLSVGTKVVKTVRAALKRSGTACRFASAAFAKPKGTLKVKASFAGNAILAPVSSR